MKSQFTIIIIALFFFNQPGHATPYPTTADPVPTAWHANWIAAPGDEEREYGIYYFRKHIELAAKPATFIVHISADNRYKLYVNDSLVSLDPAKNDLYNWNYETVNLTPY